MDNLESTDQGLCCLNLSVFHIENVCECEVQTK